MSNKIKLTICLIVTFFMFSQTVVFAGTASLFIPKPVTKLEVGDHFTVSVEASSPDQSINAVSGAVTFSEDMLHVVSISKNNSIISLWTREPAIQRNQINFEGIILNPGYQGQGANIFNITFEARGTGLATLGLSEGAVLANNGLGTNILNFIHSVSFNILPNPSVPTDNLSSYSAPKPIIIPVITDYSHSVLTQDQVFIKGKGEPNALTQLSFKNTAVKSLGEQFIEYLQNKKQDLVNVIVKNDASGSFQYVSPTNLVAGAYDATPALVDSINKIDAPGPNVQLLVNNSVIVHDLIILINILALLIPIILLIVIIYFIPWYSWIRMKLIKKKVDLEKDKIEVSEYELKRQATKIDQETRQY